MSEVIRYLASHTPYEWLDLNGQCARHDGDYFVSAIDFDRVTAERDALQQRLTAADECWDELVSAVRSINRSPHYMVKAIDDDQPQYRQREEWIDWVLGLCDAAPTSGARSNKDYAIDTLHQSGA